MSGVMYKVSSEFVFSLNNLKDILDFVKKKKCKPPRVGWSL